ncbi:MAG: CDP-alcohol phosphatidyltransferase family protein [Chloroflexi bacterium]|nr:CDP-alcohol phosphatidyltransferase family protein [Chloroflexota bacterium]
MANLLTISRFPLLLIVVIMLYLGSPAIKLISVFLLFLSLMIDTVDGTVARKTGKESLAGSVLDIAADRVYELVLWVSLADLGMIPIAIPLIVITRTTLTDAIRSVGTRNGKAAFKQHGSKLGKFIVSSAWMRSGYSVAKIVAFTGLTLGLALAEYPSDSQAARYSSSALPIFQKVAWVAVAFCVVRGLPVIGGALRRSVTAAAS